MISLVATRNWKLVVTGSLSIVLLEPAAGGCRARAGSSTVTAPGSHGAGK